MPESFVASYVSYLQNAFAHARFVAEIVAVAGAGWLAIAWPLVVTAYVIDNSAPPHSIEALGIGIAATALYWIFVLYPAVMFLTDGGSNA